MTKRITISFSARCALKCPYCYAPFNGVQPSESVLLDILGFAKEEQIDVVTFGGGDPFQYSVFRKAVRKAKELGFLVHVDTHAIGLRDPDFALIRDAVDLLGLPMDGWKEMHDSMRQSPGHFSLVADVFARLVSQKTAVKINTVVSRLNLSSLSQLANALRVNPPAIWSLYEFVELASASEANIRYALSPGEFISVVHDLLKNHSEFRIEVGSSDRRKTGYLFARTDGVLLTRSQTGAGYVELGSIYEVEWRKRFYELNRTMLPELSESRYYGTGIAKASQRP